jgi:hypothetical protein
MISWLLEIDVSSRVTVSRGEAEGLRYEVINACSARVH